MNGVRIVLLSFILALMLTGCTTSTLMATSKSSMSNAVVVDLNALSKATGQDDIINRELEIVNANLNKQLQDITANLNKQLAEHKKIFGASITVDQQQQLQELLIKANQQLEQKRAEANQKSARHKKALILAWRKKIQPVVMVIAKSKGADVVLVQSPLLMWFDSTIDITDEVLAELRANPAVFNKKDEAKSVKKDRENKKFEMPIGSGDVI